VERIADPQVPSPKFVHGLRVDDDHWPDLWNFSLAGTRSSIGLANALQFAETPYDVDLTVLEGPPELWPNLFLSGFMVTLRLGAIVRAGGKIGWGIDPYPTTWASPEQCQAVLRAADRELALEAGRRRYAAAAPSRLCCLWLAEATAKGRNWVGQMLGRDSFVLEVSVAIQLNWFRADARWLDAIADDSEAAIAGYWSGGAHAADPLWEYLLEGQIFATDAEDLALIRGYIDSVGPPQDMLGPPAELRPKPS